MSDLPRHRFAWHKKRRFKFWNYKFRRLAVLVEEGRIGLYAAAATEPEPKRCGFSLVMDLDPEDALRLAGELTRAARGEPIPRRETAEVLTALRPVQPYPNAPIDAVSEFWRRKK